MGKKRPTDRTYDKLRKDGVRSYARAEHWNPYAGVHGQREDMFGFIDIIALLPGTGFLAIQACGRGEMPAHRRKILTECREAAMDWLNCGGFIEIYCWRELKVKRGGKRMYWAVEVETITMEMFK